MWTGVITSYSIHYTKLYEAYDFQERVKALSLEDFESLFEQAEVHLLDVFGDYKLRKFDKKSSERLVMIFRITSYNVCYTKLLRNGIGIAYYLQDEKDKAKDSWIELHKIMGNNDMAEYFENANFNNSVNHWISEATSRNNFV